MPTVRTEYVQRHCHVLRNGVLWVVICRRVGLLAWGPANRSLRPHQSPEAAATIRFPYLGAGESIDAIRIDVNTFPARARFSLLPVLLSPLGVR